MPKQVVTAKPPRRADADEPDDDAPPLSSPAVLSVRLFIGEPGHIWAEVEMKGEKFHARRAVVDEETIELIKDAAPWDGKEPH